jgi:hypothetical protein
MSINNFLKKYFLFAFLIISFQSSFANEFEEKSTTLKDIFNKKSSTIAIGNLKLGQTGVVVHKYSDDLQIIVSNAKVVISDENFSVIEFFKFEDLKQDAIATTKKEPQVGDEFILNFMYKNSLLIAPNFESFNQITKDFSSHRFIHPDIFAAKLKYENSLYPTKKEIQDFAIEQNLGTIFFLVENSLYIVDSKTFSILKKINFETNKESEKKLPFFTRVEDIRESLINFNIKNWFKEKESYDSHYKKILGL